MSKNSKTIIVAISGASGVVYAQRLLDVLSGNDCQVHVMATACAQRILAEELAVTQLSAQALLGHPCDKLTFHDNDNLFDQLASGSFKADAMVVCPCSSHSLASIASGLGNTLLLRSAYVCLKQRRRLVLVHRETPLSAIDLENMSRVTRAGGIICPACPAFYMRPQSITDLVDSVVGRVLDLLEVEHDLAVRWKP